MRVVGNLLFLLWLDAETMATTTSLPNRLADRAKLAIDKRLYNLSCFHLKRKAIQLSRTNGLDTELSYLAFDHNKLPYF